MIERGLIRRSDPALKDSIRILVTVVAVLAVLVVANFIESDLVETEEQTQTVDAQWEKLAKAALDSELDDLEEKPVAEWVPGGDTIFVRRSGLAPKTSPDAVARLAMINLIPDASLRMARLREIADASTDPLVLYRINLELAFVMMRAGQYEEARSLARDLQNADGLPQDLTVDALFVEAMAIEVMGDTKGSILLLKRAIQLDPSYWNARQALFQSLTRYLRTYDVSAAECLANAIILLELTIELPRFSTDAPRLMLDLADGLMRASSSVDPVGSFIAGVAYRLSGDKGRAIRSFTEASEREGRLDPRCRQKIQSAARDELKELVRK
jgi:tetratricopeptide (TPR) repeat protein